MVTTVPSDPGDPSVCVGRIAPRSASCSGAPVWRGRLGVSPWRWFFCCDAHRELLTTPEPLGAM